MSQEYTGPTKSADGDGRSCWPRAWIVRVRVLLPRRRRRVRGCLDYKSIKKQNNKRIIRRRHGNSNKNIARVSINRRLSTFFFFQIKSWKIFTERRATSHT